MARQSYLYGSRTVFWSLFLEGGGEQCAYTLIHVQLPYRVINMQGGRRGVRWTLENLESLKNFKF